MYNDYVTTCTITHVVLYIQGYTWVKDNIVHYTCTSVVIRTHIRRAVQTDTEAEKSLKNMFTT